MRLLSFLTRKQAWLSPTEISNEFRINNTKISTRTIHRWLSVLREKGGLVYYPYPRANVLGLADVLVTVHGLTDPRVLGIIPFASYFTVEISLDRGEPLIRQGYWIPAKALDRFREFWKAAQDIGLLRGFEIYQSRNTHYIFSSFEEMITEDGSAVFDHPSDNSHFKTQIQKDLQESFDIRLGEPLKQAPLLIPLVVEHIWGYYSSRQVWEAIGQKDLSSVWKYVKGLRTRDFRRPGAALHILQNQWDNLLQHFDEVFIQPRVFFDWPALKNSAFFTVMMQASSAQTMIDATNQMSEHAIVTALKPSIELDGSFHISCFLPSDQLAPIARIAGEYHAGRTPPTFAIQDRAKTLELFQPQYCKLDWSCFEPSSLSWTFDGEKYLELLKTFKPHVLTQSAVQ